MEYLRYLGNLNFSPILILTMGIVGLVLSTFIKSIVEIILVKPFGMKVTDFSIFGFKFSKSRSGKWESRGRKPSVGLEVYTSFDLEKTAGTDSKKLIANEKAYLTVVGIVTLVLGIVVFAGLLAATFSVSSFALASVFFFIGAWTLAFVIFKFCLALSILAKVNAGKSLSGYTQEGISMIRAGIPFEKMELKPVSELNYPKVWDTERMVYFLLYFEYLDACDLFDRMPEAVADVESVLKPGVETKVSIAVCMDLIYYFSYHNYDPYNAKKYYDMIINDVTKDTDPNAMFIKGFYELNCLGNVDGAKACVVKALEKIEDHSVPVERDYCKKCIARLNYAIDNYPKQG